MTLNVNDNLINCTDSTLGDVSVAVAYEYMHLVVGRTNLSVDQEKIIANLYDQELADELRSYIVEAAMVSMSISVITGGSIDFVVRTRSETITLKESRLDTDVGGVHISISLSVVPDPDILFDRSSDHVVLNEDQYTPTSDNVVLIGIPSSVTAVMAVAVPISKPHLDLVKQGSSQCYGIRSHDGSRCCNRRRAGSGAMVWCDEHLAQLSEYMKFAEGESSQDFEAPSWW
jgi:hypothetical protein